MNQVISLIDEYVFTLRGSASDKSTKEAEKYSFKLVAEDAVDDEVNGTVYGDQEVISLCQRVILMSKMLQYIHHLSFRSFILIEGGLMFWPH